jgi:predicted porin
VKLGLGYGRSKNDSAFTGSDLRSNENLTAGVYYNLTKSVTLVGEIGQTRSKGFSGASAKQNSVAIGGILFF